MTWVAKTPPFVKYTDFVGEILVPNLVPDTTVGDANIEELERTITKYEKMLLVNILSEDGYTTFLAQVGSSSCTTLYQELYNMLFVNNKVVASYIYYYHVRNSATMTGGVGEVLPSVENGMRAVASQKMVRAYNEFSHWIYDVIDYIMENEATFGAISNSVNFGLLKAEYGTINVYGI